MHTDEINQYPHHEDQNVSYELQKVHSQLNNFTIKTVQVNLHILKP